MTRKPDHSSPSRLSRRRALGVAGFACSAPLWAAGCSALSTEPEQKDDQPSGRRRGGKEAPALRQRVKSGDLPKLRDRLPRNPRTIQPVEREGVYGGALQSGLLGTANSAPLYTLTGYDNLVKWSAHWTGAAGAKEVQPNVAEKFEIRDDGARYIFHLRPGMRWSDGEPFTVDDILFAINDVFFNQEITPVPPRFLTTADGEPATAKKLSEHQLQVLFPAPSGLFLQYLASPGGRGLTEHPRHYLKRFHKKYNGSVDQLVDKENQRDWISLFGAKAAADGANPDLPTVAAWKLVNPFGKGTVVKLERNPYYWKVDPSGRQLPYLD